MEKTNELCEFLGWHCGDGCISVNDRYSEYTLTGDIREEKEFYENIIFPVFYKLFRKKLKKEPKIKFYESVGVCGLYIFNKEFVKFLTEEFNIEAGKKIGKVLPIDIFKTEEQKKCFLRGFFDTDGSIYFCKSNFKTKMPSLFTKFHYKPKIGVATISKKLIEGVKEILIELGYSPRVKNLKSRKNNELPVYGIILDRKRDTRKFIEEIGFKSTKHLTKIAVWKKYGFCPAFTTLDERVMILNESLDPFEKYGTISAETKEEISSHLKSHQTYQ